MSARHRRAGRIGGLLAHSRNDSRTMTAAARKRFLDRFLDEVDPKRQLPEAERESRAERARTAYFLKLAQRSAKARRRKAGP